MNDTERVKSYADIHDVDVTIEVRAIYVDYASCGSHRLSVKIFGELGPIERELSEALDHVKAERERVEAEITAELAGRDVRRAEVGD